MFEKKFRGQSWVKETGKNVSEEKKEIIFNHTPISEGGMIKNNYRMNENDLFFQPDQVFFTPDFGDRHVPDLTFEPRNNVEVKERTTLVRMDGIR